MPPFFYEEKKFVTKLKHHVGMQLLLLCLLVGLAYIPAYQGEPCLLDDVNMLGGLQNIAKLDLKGLLTPTSAHFTYYRPLIGLSYWVDKTLWNADPQAMHAENVLFHLLNVLLVFWLIKVVLSGNNAPAFHPPFQGEGRGGDGVDCGISVRCLNQPHPHPDLPLEGEGSKSRKPTFGYSQSVSRYLPFLGALLFAVHPITAESVNWISGRTDLISGACLLSSAIAIATWQRNRNRWWLLLPALPLLAGAIMTKELAWGFLLVLPLFLTDPYDTRTFTLTQLAGTFSRLEKLLLLMAVVLCFLLAATMLSFWPVIILSALLGLVVLYRKPRLQPLSWKARLLASALLLIAAILLPYCVKLARQGASNGIFSNLKRTVFLISHDFDNSIGLFSATIAFYIKKFFLPLPLSFSIIEIAPGYLFGGIAVIILTAFLIVWRSSAAILFLAGIALLLPALPLVHGQIAWAPYAERYMYVSSGFWIASLAIGLHSITLPSLRTPVTALCLLLIPVATVISYQRSTVWQTNVALFGDTVQKSPNHIEARVLYMTALARADRLPEAVAQFRLIQTDPRSWRRVRYFHELAELLVKRGQKREALEVLDSALSITLPLGMKHPLQNEEWKKLYAFRTRLQQELSPQKSDQ